MALEKHYTRLVAAGEIRLPVNGLQPQLLHQLAHAFAIHVVIHLPRTEERIRQMRFIDDARQAQVLIG